jgi:hypothetical protein
MIGDNGGDVKFDGSNSDVNVFRETARMSPHDHDFQSLDTFAARPIRTRISNACLKFAFEFASCGS